MITNHTKGIASTQLARDLRITQKSAWFMLRRLRHAAQTKSFNRPLEGMVEADETHMGESVRVNALLGQIEGRLTYKALIA